MLTKIVAVVVDTKVLTLYREDGTTLEISQGDPRVTGVLEAMPEIEAKGFAMLDFTRPNPYREFEEKSSGFVRFFRVAKEKIAGVFSSNIAPVGSAGKVPQPQIDPVSQKAVETPEAPKFSQAAAVDEIMQHAQPATADDFDPEETSTHTVVAVTQDKKVIPAAQLEKHIAHSNKVASTVGMENFLKRIGAVIDQRGHSIQDVLRFMEKNDLPIADDGSLIVYKVLRKKDGEYRDCHTGQVPQKIGSFVCMDPKMVDPNRRNECSNGLHVARRGYIGGFGGDCCTIVKVAPEDVIAVPNYDANKVRVCGYHILMELDRDAWDLLKRNTPMTSNPRAQKMLGRAISGEHVGVLELVTIKGQHGTRVERTPVKGEPKAIAKSVQAAVALDDETVKTAAEKPVDVQKVAADVKNIIKTGSARQAQARQLMDVINDSSDAEHRRKAAMDLMALKRTAKVSWSTLGIGEAESKEILELSATKAPEAPVEETVRVTAQGEDVNKVEDRMAAKEAKAQPKAKAKDTRPKHTGPRTVTPGPRAMRITNLIAVIDESKDNAHRAAAARELLDIRRQAARSWAKMGHPEMEDQKLRDIVNGNIDVAPPKAVPVGKSERRVAAKATKKEKSVRPLRKPASAVTAPVQPSAPSTEAAPAKAGTRQDRAAKMFEAEDWNGLWQLKKQSKYSWKALGLDDTQIRRVELKKPDWI